MKYIKTGNFTTQQMSIDETITETKDVILISKNIIENLESVPDSMKKELDLAINNLNQAVEYLEYIQRKAAVALKFVPEDIQQQEYL